jgi:Zn-dependent oligopeptidase
MVTGYASGYYSYLWSEMVACDLFSKFEEKGDFLDPELGMKLRQTVLEPCCLYTGKEMVEKFLGRPVSTKSFENSVYKQ